MLSVRLKKQTSKNVADTTFNVPNALNVPDVPNVPNLLNVLH